MALVLPHEQGRVGDFCARNSQVLRVVIIMVFFNFAVLALYVSLATYQFATRDVLPQIRLVASGQPPELRLRKGCKWHLFLSHIWSSSAER